MSEAVRSDALFRFASNALVSREMYGSNYGLPPEAVPDAESLKVALKVRSEYWDVKDSKPVVPTKPPVPSSTSTPTNFKVTKTVVSESKTVTAASVEDAMDDEDVTTVATTTTTSLDKAFESRLSTALTNIPGKNEESSSRSLVLSSDTGEGGDYARGITTDIIMKNRRKQKKLPTWHAPWKLRKVIAGHQGWVRCICVDPSNEWFATGSADRTIKIWSLGSNELKLTLTGHISGIRAVDVSHRSPYLFSAGEDYTIKCWDLESNTVIRDYYGHRSGVTALRVHPELDLIVSGGRDSSVRVWDIRTKTCISTLTGHQSMVGSVDVQGCEPQIISGSQDGTVRLWDVVAGKTLTTLTHHKKSVRSVKIHPLYNSFSSGSTDAIKTWKLPEPVFMRNVQGHNGVCNSININTSNVLASGLDNGILELYDWNTGYKFQSIASPPQSGSLDSEAGILAVQFDMTNTRLLTAESDKTIKIYSEDPHATPETHPINLNQTTSATSSVS